MHNLLTYNAVIVTIYHNEATRDVVTNTVIKYSLDFDECAAPDLNNCDENAECNNTIGSYTCSCHSGYYGDGFECLGM